MNLYLGSIAKVIALVIAIALSQGGVVDDSKVDDITGYVLMALTGIYEWWETRRLAKQGVKSTNPVVNAAEEMTPAKLVADEKVEAAKP